MKTTQPTAPGQSAPESAIKLLEAAALRLGAHTRDAEGQGVAKRIYNFLAQFPTHFVTQFLERRKDGSVVVHQVPLGDWPDWAGADDRGGAVVVDRKAAPLDLDRTPMVEPPVAPGAPGVRAKAITWTQDPDGTEWMGGDWGFHIEFVKDPEEDQPYTASWGEGDSDSFTTLEEAQEWCQGLAEHYVQLVAEVAP